MNKRLTQNKVLLKTRQDKIHRTRAARLVKKKLRCKSWLKVYRSPNSMVLPSPKTLDLYNNFNRNQTLIFIEDFREAVIKNVEKVYLDFTNLTKVHVDGMILLYSEIRRVKRLLKSSIKIRIIKPKHRKVLQVFKQIGLLKYFELNDKGINLTFSDVINWMFAYGEEIDAEHFSGLFDKYEGKVTPKLLTTLFTGMSEVMINCVQHAYNDSRGDGISMEENNTPWWMFSQEKDGYVTISLCDLGVGIPETLPKKHKSWWDSVAKDNLGIFTDSDIIKYATGEGISSTEKKYRGKGLRQTISLSKKYLSSSIYIFSNKGLYSIVNGKENKVNYERSIHGTIIVWKIPLLDSGEPAVVS